MSESPTTREELRSLAERYCDMLLHISVDYFRMSDWDREEYVHEHTCDSRRACEIFCPIELERIAEYFDRDTIERQRIDRRKIVGRPERKAALIEELIEIGAT